MGGERSVAAREKSSGSARSGRNEARSRILFLRLSGTNYILQKIGMQGSFDHIEHRIVKCKCKKKLSV